MNTHRTFDLAYWINERYDIKLRRDQGLPPPWTGDGVMQTVRWCNVHREDDAVTRWMRQNWHYNGTHPVWWWVLGRMLNYIPTLEVLTPDNWMSQRFGPAEIADVLKEGRRRGKKIFTSAYTISTCGKSMDKIDYVVDWVVARVKETEELDEKTGNTAWGSLKGAWEWMQQVDGLGSFLAAQVVADLKNTPGHPLQDAPDWWGWAAPGPGSLRGLNWYFQHRPDGTITPRMFNSAISEAYEEVMPLVHDRVPRIGMQDFQNCLCEFSKYMKVKNLNGHVRNKYRPAG